MEHIKRITTNRRKLLFYLVTFAVLGTAYLALTKAATPSYGVEAEGGLIQSPAAQIADNTASGGSALQFGGAAETLLPPVGITGYTLKWNDEFSGTVVDISKWNVQNNSNYGTGNAEDECYLASNTTVGNGVLNLTAKKQTVSTCPANPDGYDKTKYYWTSGMVTTKAQGGVLKYKFTQGYAETRMKAPISNAYWPAFWLVGTGEAGQPSWPAYGEFDVSELYGANPDNTTGTLHYACPTHCKTIPNTYNIKANDFTTGASLPPLTSGATNDWHTYGLLWGTNRLTWYVDGKPRLYFDGTNNTMHTVDSNNNSLTTKQLTAPTTDFWSVAHSIHLNLAVGGAGPTYHGYTGKESATSASYDDGNLVGSVPSAMQVDYVRVWQK